jgi:hypothetical protein
MDSDYYFHCLRTKKVPRYKQTRLKKNLKPHHSRYQGTPFYILMYSITTASFLSQIGVGINGIVLKVFFVRKVEKKSFAIPGLVMLESVLIYNL